MKKFLTKTIIAGLLSSAIIVNPVSAQNFIAEPSSDDPTAEYPLFILNNFSEENIKDFRNYIAFTGTEAYIIDAKNLTNDILDSIKSEYQLDTERTYILSFNNEISGLEDICLQYIYNPFEKKETTDNDIVYVTLSDDSHGENQIQDIDCRIIDERFIVPDILSAERLLADPGFGWICARHLDLQ